MSLVSFVRIREGGLRVLVSCVLGDFLINRLSSTKLLITYDRKVYGTIREVFVRE